MENKRKSRLAVFEHVHPAEDIPTKKPRLKLNLPRHLQTINDDCDLTVVNDDINRVSIV